jgi:hypothetical protein
MKVNKEDVVSVVFCSFHTGISTSSSCGGVLRERNGYVLPLDEQAWVSAASELLSTHCKWESFSQCARQTVKGFNYSQGCGSSSNCIFSHSVKLLTI